MSSRNVEIADWKLSAVIALVGRAAEDNDAALSSDELLGLFYILRDVQELITPALQQVSEAEKDRRNEQRTDAGF